MDQRFNENKHFNKHYKCSDARVEIRVVKLFVARGMMRLLNDKIEEFYAMLPEVNEPLTDSEKEQLRGNTEWIPLEEIEREL